MLYLTFCVTFLKKVLLAQAGSTFLKSDLEHPPTKILIFWPPTCLKMSSYCHVCLLLSLRWSFGSLCAPFRSPSKAACGQSLVYLLASIYFAPCIHLDLAGIAKRNGPNSSQIVGWTDNMQGIHMTPSTKGCKVAGVPNEKPVNTYTSYKDLWKLIKTSKRFKTYQNLQNK